MGRGDDRRSGQAGAPLLFGPRRQPRTRRSLPAGDLRCRRDAELLLEACAAKNFRQTITTLANHSDADLSQAPHLSFLVESVAELIWQGSHLDDDEYLKFIGLLVDQVEQGSSGSAVVSLVEPLARRALLNDSPTVEDLKGLAAISQMSVGSDPIFEELRSSILAIGDTWFAEDAQEEASLRLDSFLDQISHHDSPQAAELTDAVLSARRRWPPRYWGALLQQQLYSHSDPDLLQRAQGYLREDPRNLDYAGQLEQAHPVVRARIEEAVTAWARHQQWLLGPAAGLEAIVDRYHLAALDKKEKERLEAATQALGDQLIIDQLERPEQACTLSRQRHQQLLTDVMAEWANADLDVFCAQLAEASDSHRRLWNELRDRAQEQRGQTGKSQPRLSDIFAPEIVRDALYRSFNLNTDDDPPFVVAFGSVAFLRELRRRI